MIRFIGILFLVNNFPPSLQADTASQLILRKRAAVTVSPVRMYADSMYSKSTEGQGRSRRVDLRALGARAITRPHVLLTHRTECRNP